MDTDLRISVIPLRQGRMITVQCDEHVKSAITKGLRARGLVVYSVEDEDLKGISDKELFEHCIKTTGFY